MPSWAPGTVVLGKYTIIERVGRGGMATVYAARHRNGKRVAIKALHSSHQETKASVDRFFREGVIANLIEHPGALEVYDEGRTSEGVCVLVCEYLEGCTLHELQQSSGKPLSLAEVSDAVLQVLDVLIVAHAAGVIHRDVKPANLFLTTSSRVKLLDFGVARSLAGIDAISTVDGELLGTPAFMSPEQACGIVAELDATSDLWSLSATAIALLSGKSPREGRSVSELLMAAMTEPMPPSAFTCSDLPAAVAAVLDRAVARDKSARFASALAFREAMVAALPDAPGNALSGEAARQIALARNASPKPLWPGTKFVFRAAALLALGALLAGAASVLRSADVPQPPLSVGAPLTALVPALGAISEDAGTTTDSSVPLLKLGTKVHLRAPLSLTKDAAAPKAVPANELDRRY